MQRIPLSIEVKKILKMLMATLLFLLFTASGYFFIKMSLGAEKGYQLKENQIRRQQLEAEKRLLEQQVLDAQSLQNLQKSDVVEKMAPASEKSIYVKPVVPIMKR